MKVNKFLDWLRVAVTTSSIFSISVAAAGAVMLNQGVTMHTFTECLNDGIALVYGSKPTETQAWYYSTDNPNDSFPYGGSAYEIYGMAARETSDSLWIVINANLPITGAENINAQDGNIGWGDVFLNLSGLDFNSAMSTGQLSGIRFAQTNNSSVPIGVYGGVIAKSVVKENSGFGNLQNYNNFAGRDASFGDLPGDTGYFIAIEVKLRT